MENSATSILDTIKTNPVYTGKILSTKKTFKYRPYTVGEEQSLLLAKESNDANTIIESTKNVISSCTFGEVDPEKLASFDIEYMLLQLRSKSVGEEIELTIKCNHCKKTNDATINIDDITLPDIGKDANIISLNDDLHLVMDWPGFDVLEGLKEDADIFNMVASLIRQIVADEKVIETSELSTDHVVKFIKRMNSKTFKKITDYIKDIPSLQYDLNLKCMHCSEDNKYSFRGIKNFFA